MGFGMWVDFVGPRWAWRVMWSVVWAMWMLVDDLVVVEVAGHRLWVPASILWSYSFSAWR